MYERGKQTTSLLNIRVLDLSCLYLSLLQPDGSMTDSADNQNSDLVDLAGDIVSRLCREQFASDIRAGGADSECPCGDRAAHHRGGRARLRRRAPRGDARTDPQVGDAGGIVSFLDGKTYKTLKRHLTGHGLDPHSYRRALRPAGGLPDGRAELCRPAFGPGKVDRPGRVGDRSEAPQPTAKGRGKAA